MVSRNHPLRKTTWSSSRPNRSKLARTCSSDTASSGCVWKSAPVSAGNCSLGGGRPSNESATMTRRSVTPRDGEHCPGQDRGAPAPHPASRMSPATPSSIARSISARKLWSRRRPTMVRAVVGQSSPSSRYEGSNLDGKGRARQWRVGGAVAGECILELVQVARPTACRRASRATDRMTLRCSPWGPFPLGPESCRLYQSRPRRPAGALVGAAGVVVSIAAGHRGGCRLWTT